MTTLLETLRKEVITTYLSIVVLLLLINFFMNTIFGYIILLAGLIYFFVRFIKIKKFLGGDVSELFKKY